MHHHTAKPRVSPDVTVVWYGTTIIFEATPHSQTDMTMWYGMVWYHTLSEKKFVRSHNSSLRLPRTDQPTSFFLCPWQAHAPQWRHPSA